MCGIAGRLNLDGDTVSYKKSAEIIHLIRHRGPGRQTRLFIEIIAEGESYCLY